MMLFPLKKYLPTYSQVLGLYWVYLMLSACNQPKASQEKRNSFSPVIMTVQGPVASDSLGMALPHEHILVDFIGAQQVSKDRYEPDSVIQKALPYLQEVQSLGGEAFFECTPAYLGRDVEVLLQLSRMTGLHIITNTGYYGTQQGKFLPDYVYTESPEQLAQRWIAEWEDGIEGTAIRPGFIKISVNNDSLNEADRKLVHAAAITHKATGLTIGSHTTSGPSVIQLLDILEERGVSPTAFIWIHAQTVKDSAYHREVADRGAWLEFDGISDQEASLDLHLGWIDTFKKWGKLDQVLLSHDAGWYQIGEPGGGEYRSHSAVFQAFIPQLLARGYSEEIVENLFRVNPQNAFTIRKRTL